MTARRKPYKGPSAIIWRYASEKSKRAEMPRSPPKSKEVLKLTQSFAVHEDDMDMVRHALKSYLEACEREVANGATMPFIADKVVIPKIRAALEDELERAVTSTSLMWAARKQL